MSFEDGVAKKHNAWVKNEGFDYIDTDNDGVLDFRAKAFDKLVDSGFPGGNSYQRPAYKGRLQ